MSLSWLQPVLSAGPIRFHRAEFQHEVGLSMDLAYQWQNVKQMFKYCFSSLFYRQGRQFENVNPSTAA